jgi:hypothetical protein
VLRAFVERLRESPAVRRRNRDVGRDADGVKLVLAAGGCSIVFGNGAHHPHLREHEDESSSRGFAETEAELRAL